VGLSGARGAYGATSELWAAAEQDRRAYCGRLVRAVADHGPLRTGWDVDTATDAVWLAATPRAAHTALATLGWSLDRLVDAVTSQLCALLLPSDDRNPV